MKNKTSFLSQSKRVHSPLAEKIDEGVIYANEEGLEEEVLEHFDERNKE
jgi:hypothetical protein